MQPNMQTVQSQPMMYIPVPTSTTQFPTTGNQVINQPIPNVQPQAQNSMQAPNQSQVSTSQEFPTESGNSDNKVSSAANPVPTPTSSHDGHAPVMMHPYPMNAAGGFYLPQPMPMPYAQFPPNAANLPPNAANLPPQGRFKC